jgi:hypothetical protein
MELHLSVCSILANALRFCDHLPEYHYPEDEQQDHGPALASFGLAAEPLASFVTE